MCLPPKLTHTTVSPSMQAIHSLARSSPSIGWVESTLSCTFSESSIGDSSSTTDQRPVGRARLARLLYCRS